VAQKTARSGFTICGLHFSKMGSILVFIVILFTARTIKAQENDQELYEEVVKNEDVFLQHQTAFCQLWLEATVDRQHSLNNLCFRLAKKFSDKVILFPLLNGCNTLNNFAFISMTLWHRVNLSPRPNVTFAIFNLLSRG
jgi:hypothetical protein